MKLNPILKWAGGKRWLAPKIKEIFEQTNSKRLVEPFCGGLSVCLEVNPSTALINDLNLHLINFYYKGRKAHSFRCGMDSTVYVLHNLEVDRLTGKNNLSNIAI